MFKIPKGIRFRKKVKLTEGVDINLNTSCFKKGGAPSLTIGCDSLGVNVNKDGAEGFANVYGTGLAYRSKVKSVKPIRRGLFWKILMILGIVKLLDR